MIIVIHLREYKKIRKNYGALRGTLLSMTMTGGYRHQSTLYFSPIASLYVQVSKQSVANTKVWLLYNCRIKCWNNPLKMLMNLQNIKRLSKNAIHCHIIAFLNLFHLLIYCLFYFYIVLFYFVLFCFLTKKNIVITI